MPKQETELGGAGGGFAGLEIFAQGRGKKTGGGRLEKSAGSTLKFDSRIMQKAAQALGLLGAGCGILQAAEFFCRKKLKLGQMVEVAEKLGF